MSSLDMGNFGQAYVKDILKNADRETALELCSNLVGLVRERTRLYVGEKVILLIGLGEKRWLLAGIFRVENEELTELDDDLFPYTGFAKTKIVEGWGLERLYGSLVVELVLEKRPYTMRGGSDFLKSFRVVDYLGEGYSVPGFPGCENVRISFSDLKVALSREDWRVGLRSQRAVYLITDCATGKLYVGSATSENGRLLRRWEDYLRNGYGGNVMLETLLEERSFGYAEKNFQFSILETFDSKRTDEHILMRESWWKDALRSREHGYNAN